MELKEGTHVYSLDGKDVGEVNRFVLDPVSKKVTHIVVKKGVFFPEDRVVPMSWVDSSQSDQLTLSARSDMVKDLPPFEETHYINLDETERRRFSPMSYGEAPAYFWNPSFGTPALGMPVTGNADFPFATVKETAQNIPENTVALKEGAKVISEDDENVGSVERLFTNPQSKQVTHFMISKGLLVKEKKLIPVDWVRLFEDDKVYLAVGSTTVDRLPAYQEGDR